MKIPPLDFRAQDVEYRRSVADFLESKKWHYFFTITFRRPRRDVISIQRDVKQHLRGFTRGRAFIAIEPHKSSLAHVHGLIRSSSPFPNFKASTLWIELFQRFGRSTVSPVRSQHEVAGYCSKYVAKGSAYEYDFIGGKEAWRW